MEHLINSEYVFTRKMATKTIELTLYIDYGAKKYDIVQDGEEGILPRKNNISTKTNIAFMELAIEALNFVESELFTKK